MTPYKAFRLYQAFYAYFKGDYDLFKYGAKLKSVSPKLFEEHKNKVLFGRLAKLHDVPGRLLANFAAREISFVGECMDDTANEIYLEWLKRNESMFYRFCEELKFLAGQENHDLLFCAETEIYPPIWKLYQQGKVSSETLIVLNSFVPCFDKWKLFYEDDLVFPWELKRLMKYSPFVEFDKEKYFSAFKEIIIDKKENV